MAHIVIDGVLHPTNTQEEIEAVEAAQEEMTARAIAALLAPLSPELRAMALARTMALAQICYLGQHEHRDATTSRRRRR